MRSLLLLIITLVIVYVLANKTKKAHKEIDIGDEISLSSEFVPQDLGLYSSKEKLIEDLDFREKKLDFFLQGDVHPAQRIKLRLEFNDMKTRKLQEYQNSSDKIRDQDLH